MVSVFVAFIRMVYGRMIYMSLPSSELTVDITIAHLVSRHFAPVPFLLSSYFMLSRFDFQVQEFDRHGG